LANDCPNVPVIATRSPTGTSAANEPKTEPREKYPPDPYILNRSRRISTFSGSAHPIRSGELEEISTRGATATPIPLACVAGSMMSALP